MQNYIIVVLLHSIKYDERETICYLITLTRLNRKCYLINTEVTGGIINLLQKGHRNQINYSTQKGRPYNELQSIYSMLFLMIWLWFLEGNFRRSNISFVRHIW